MTAWWGVFAPAHLSGTLTAALAAHAEQIVRGAAFKARLEPLGVHPSVLTGAALAEFQRKELAKWGRAVEDSGAKAEGT